MNAALPVRSAAFFYPEAGGKKPQNDSPRQSGSPAWVSA